MLPCELAHVLQISSILWWWAARRLSSSIITWLNQAAIPSILSVATTPATKLSPACALSKQHITSMRVCRCKCRTASPLFTSTLLQVRPARCFFIRSLAATVTATIYLTNHLASQLAFHPAIYLFGTIAFQPADCYDKPAAASRNNLARPAGWLGPLHSSFLCNRSRIRKSKPIEWVSHTDTDTDAGSYLLRESSLVRPRLYCPAWARGSVGHTLYANWDGNCCKRTKALSSHRAAQSSRSAYLPAEWEQGWWTLSGGLNFTKVALPTSSGILLLLLLLLFRRCPILILLLLCDRLCSNGCSPTCARTIGCICLGGSGHQPVACLLHPTWRPVN